MALDAGPAIGLIGPIRDDEVGSKGLALEGQLAAGLDGKRGAVEYQFILAADLIEIQQRYAVLAGAGADQVLADMLLVGPIASAPVRRRKQDAILRQLGLPPLIKGEESVNDTARRISVAIWICHRLQPG